MKTLIRSFVISLTLALGLVASAQAQTIPSETTLSAALTTPTTRITLASVSTTPTSNWAVGNYLWIENEAMQIQQIPSSGTTLIVLRGQLQTAVSPHKASAIVYAANAGSFFYSNPSGGPPNAQGQGGGTGVYCVRTQWQYMPQIDTRTGIVWACPASPVGSTTPQSWAGTAILSVTSGSRTASPF